MAALDPETVRTVVQTVLDELGRPDSEAHAILDEVARRASRETLERLLPTLRRVVDLLESDLRATEARRDAIDVEALRAIASAGWTTKLGKA